jgi:radical SAM protein with 4Fe4S-binding SPASM domain
MRTLINAYNPSTVEGLMCRHQISVDPTGRMYDCDFNQAIGLQLHDHESQFVWETSLSQLADRIIATADHCYACTAGAGSSCGGAIAS